MPRKKGTPWKIDKTGMQYSSWTVLNREPNSFWKCRCKCGTEKIIHGTTLIRGTSKSCGCTGSDWCRTHGKEGTRIYNLWASMLQRCNNPKTINYKHYGAKGIKVCEEWRRFENFYADMGDKPENMTLDRIDGNSDYRKDNCRWATGKQQHRNVSNVKKLEYNGATKSLPEWAELFGLNRQLVNVRIKKGWTIERALNTPSRKDKVKVTIRCIIGAPYLNIYRTNL